MGRRGRLVGVMGLGVALLAACGSDAASNDADDSSGKTQETCIRQVSKWAENPPDVSDMSTFVARVKVAELSVVECPSAAVWDSVVASIDPDGAFYDWSDPAVRNNERGDFCDAMAALDPPAC